MKTIDQIEEDLTDTTTKLFQHLKQGGYAGNPDSILIYKYDPEDRIMFRTKTSPKSKWIRRIGMNRTDEDVLQWLELNVYILEIVPNEKEYK